MRVLMLVISDVDRDARVSREATTLAEAGHDVTVIALAGTSRSYSVVPVAAASPLPGGGVTGRGRLRPLRRAARWALLPQHELALRRSFARAARRAAGTLGFDVVHAHDFETLELGAELARQRRARLVYDAHEYWSGRHRTARQTPLRLRREREAERQVGRTAEFVLTVSPALAQRLARDHGWSDVRVVRNTFPVVVTAPGLRSPSALVYAGKVGPGRDLETLSLAAPELPLPVLLVGPTAGGPSLRNVELQPPVPIDDVDEIMRTAGLAHVPLTDTCENHRLALPNKLFQAIRAGVPVVAADLPQLRELVLGEGLGEVYRPGDPVALRAAVDRACARYTELVANVRHARQRHTWSVDARVLLDAYTRLEAA